MIVNKSFLKEVIIPEETRLALHEASLNQIMMVASDKDKLMSVGLNNGATISRFFFGTDVSLKEFKTILKQVLQTLGPIKKGSQESECLRRFMSGVKSEYGLTWPINVSDEKMIATINKVLKVL